MKWIFSFLTASLLFSTVWANDILLKDVKTSTKNGNFVVEYTFNQQVDPRKLTYDFKNETVQIDVPNAFLEEKKRFTSVNNEKVKNLYSYQLNNENLRLKVIFKNGFVTEKLQGNVEESFQNNKMILTFAGVTKAVEKSAVANTAPAAVDIVPAAVAGNGSENAALSQVVVSSADPADKKVAETEEVASANAEDAPLLAEKPDKSAKESEIPVLKTYKAEGEKPSHSPWTRFAMTFIILSAIIGGGFVMTKQWSKQKMKNPHTHIKILTQHHIGPKKSLAIIRVAGESILIGITDNNINLIKELSLLDEDIPEASSGTQFNETMSNYAAADEDRYSASPLASNDNEDEFSFSGIKDIVSSKLKNMRHL